MYKFLGAALVVVTACSAHADFIDFPAAGPANTHQAVMTYGIATFTVTGGTVDKIAPGDQGYVHGGMCGDENFVGVCTADFTMALSSQVTNLKFFTVGFNPGDTVLITAYNGLAVVGSEVVESNKLVDFGSASITRVVFDDSSTNSGFGFGDFSYSFPTRDPGNNVPEPGSLALLSVGIAGLGAARKRKQA